MRFEKNKVSKCFGKVLKSTREDVGASQAELAEKANINRTFISFLERGLRQPTMMTVLAVAAALKTRAGTLVNQVEQCLQRNQRRSR